MTADPSKVALYCQGTFDVAHPTPAQLEQMKGAAVDIGRSGFGTVLLGQWHVHDDGSIYYNNSALDSVMDNLQTITPILLDGGTVRNVLISFGPFGSDFQHIQQHYDTFTAAMDQVQSASGIQGYDWDLEEDYEQLAELLVDLTKWATSNGLMVTAAPYTEMDTWIEVLQATMSGGVPSFAFWNLQLYGGASYGDWVEGLKNDLADPQAFLVPGYAVHLGATPDGVKADLAQLYASYPQVAGGFVWQYEDIVANGYTATQFADAIYEALGSTATLPS